MPTPYSPRTPNGAEHNRLTRTPDGGLAHFDYGALRVLVVEPDQEARGEIETALGLIGLRRIFGASNPEKAIELAGEVEMDFMLCDGRLDYPDGPDGLQFVMDIREDKTPMPFEIPVLLCAGEAASFSVMEAKRLGVDDFLIKPVAQKRLHVAIQRLVQTHFPDRVHQSA